MIPLYGLQVIPHPYLKSTPKVQLSTDCPCTSEFRDEFNQWLTDFFGSDEPILVSGNFLFTTEKGLQQIVNGTLSIGDKF